MKKLLYIIALLVCPAMLRAGDVFTTDQLHIRDPYILADRKSGTYYLYCSSSVRSPHGVETGGVAVYKSRDLKLWEGPEQVLTVPEDNWISGPIWAPEVHAYKGRYYIFATINSDIDWKRTDPGLWARYTHRAVQTFVSDKPTGPFKRMDSRPVTPLDYMALDGTLYVEDGKPYMVFCHEWVQIADGSFEFIPLKRDLSGAAGEPVRMFNASAADWVAGTPHEDGLVTYVSDGCFMYRDSAGDLRMLWSSFSSRRYEIGVSRSVSGRLDGPWVHDSEPISIEDGGHAMVFKGFDSQLYIVYHAPNSGGVEHPVIRRFNDDGGRLEIVKN